MKPWMQHDCPVESHTIQIRKAGQRAMSTDQTVIVPTMTLSWHTSTHVLRISNHALRHKVDTYIQNLTLAHAHLTETHNHTIALHPTTT